eukprot:gene9801-biopygen106746
MIIEASGGSWGDEARSLFQDLSKSSSRLTGDPAAEKLEQFHQTLSVCLHRCNARAILRRCPAVPPPASAAAAAQAALASAEAERSAGAVCLDQAH